MTSVEMTILGVGGKNGQRQRQKQMRGFFATLRMTGVGDGWSRMGGGNGRLRLGCSVGREAGFSAALLTRS